MTESRSGIPSQPTPLIGRQHEVQAVRALLARDDVRLVTLTVPGGVGKTRVGVEVLGRLPEQLVDGATFVDLAPIDDSALLTATVADALGVRDTGRRPLFEVLTEYLSQKNLLLLLDSFERILPAATTVADLLAACPCVKVLVTSRAPLHLRGEHEYAVPPLALPEPSRPLTAEELSAIPSVSLFVQRATDVRSDFVLTEANAPTVGEICRRLDGLPLAIELAAARAKLLSPQATLGWLDRRLTLLTSGARDLPARHRTLRDTIAWSYDLLGDDERRLFRRLSVFVGGCTLEAAQAVGEGDTRDAGQPGRLVSPVCLEHVASLVDSSLLREADGPGGEPRYFMLDTIRELGLEQLALSGEEMSARRDHLAWCTGFAEHVETQVRGPSGPEWLDRLAAEVDNVRAALTWSMADPEATSKAIGLRLGGAFFAFWYFRDHLDEGRRWLERVLAADRERALAGDRADGEPAGPGVGAATGPLHGDQAGWWFAIHPRVKALICLCNLCQQLGRLQEAETAILEAIALAQRIHDEVGEARATVWLAVVARSSGDYDRAVSLFETSLATFRRLSHAYGVWWTLNQLGETIMRVGDYARARVLLEECVAVAQKIGSLWGIADSRHRLGTVIFRQGDLDRAMALLEESLAAYIALQAHGLHTCLLDLGTIALARGDPGVAAEYFSRSLTRCHEIGDRYNIARSLEGLAQVASALSDADHARLSHDAARLLGAASALREEINFAVAPVERPAVERAEVAARAALGDAAYETSWSEGRSLALDQAVEHASTLASQLHAAASAPNAGTVALPVTSVPQDSPLTTREREVAALMARGLSNRQIASSLVISERTVHAHVASILSKLGFRSRSQVAAWVVRQGLEAPTDG
ncbi:MAG: tetratricopeptide repeat protein [Chloroflexi bacterium]|nr:tetratricopeptide repeat protein [Chloroflexota bacterium]